MSGSLWNKLRCYKLCIWGSGPSESLSLQTVRAAPLRPWLCSAAAPPRIMGGGPRLRHAPSSGLQQSAIHAGGAAAAPRLALPFRSSWPRDARMWCALTLNSLSPKPRVASCSSSARSSALRPLRISLHTPHLWRTAGDWGSCLGAQSGAPPGPRWAPCGGADVVSSLFGASLPYAACM